MKDLLNKDIGPKWRWQTLLLIGVLVFVLLLTMLTCGGVAKQDAAQAATTARVQGTPSGPTTISDTGKVAVAVDGKGGCPGTLWYWGPPKWWVEEPIPGHPVMYAWRLEIEWCTNRAHTAVNSVVFHFLYDAGGYYILDHKDKDCGARGNYWLNCLDEWVFRIGIPPLVNDWRRPNVRFNLGAHGEITGSVFWDN